MGISETCLYVSQETYLYVPKEAYFTQRNMCIHVYTYKACIHVYTYKAYTPAGNMVAFCF
jgi:hypothetical protein